MFVGSSVVVTAVSYHSGFKGEVDALCSDEYSFSPSRSGEEACKGGVCVVCCASEGETGGVVVPSSLFNCNNSWEREGRTEETLSTTMEVIRETAGVVILVE